MTTRDALSSDRQLQQLLALSGAGSGGAEEDALYDVHLSNVVRNLASTSTSNGGSGGGFGTIEQGRSASEGNVNGLHKLFVRIHSSLYAAHRDVTFGLRLANEALRVLPWNVVAPCAAEWIQAALTHLRTSNSSMAEAIVLLDTLLGAHARSRPEYWRNVGSTAASKYASVLLEVAEEEAKSTTMAQTSYIPLVLNAVTTQIELHPSTFRSHASRIHSLCMHFLFRRQQYVVHATTLLARLTLTGKGDEGQVALWSTTVRSLLREAQRAWRTCSSSFLEYTVSADVHEESSLFFESMPEDDLQALRVAHSRLALLLGKAPQPGILALFLAEPTAVAVPLDLFGLLDLPRSILSLSSNTLSRFDTDAVEASLVALQAALLPRAHLCAITFIASLSHTYNVPGGHGKTIKALLIAAEQGSPTIRCAAMQTLATLRWPVDPHDGLLVRCTRTCLAQLSRLIHQESEQQNASASAAAAASSTSSSVKRSSGGHKKRRLFEADQVLFAPLDGFVDMDEDEYAACDAAVRILTDLYAPLITFITPEQHDLAQTTALLMLGLTEIALKQPDTLTVTLLGALARLVATSRGTLLALLSVRASTLCAEGMKSVDEATSRAAGVLNVALSDAFNPKLPPKLALRLHVESDRIDAAAAADERDVDGHAESVLDDVLLDEDRGLSEREAMRDVLDISLEHSNTGGSGSSSGAGAVHASLPFVKNTASATGAPTDVGQSQLPTTNVTSAMSSTSASNGNAHHPSTSNTAAAAAAVFSPDPVKPIRRPSTPRIGSPGTVTPSTSKRPSMSPQHSTTAVNLVVDPTPSAAAVHVANVFENSSSSSPSAALHHQTASMVSSNANAVRRPTPSSLTNTAAKTFDLRDDDNDDDNDSDSDGSLPQLDVRSSDDEESEAN